MCFKKWCYLLIYYKHDCTSWIKNNKKQQSFHCALQHTTQQYTCNYKQKQLLFNITRWTYYNGIFGSRYYTKTELKFWKAKADMTFNPTGYILHVWLLYQILRVALYLKVGTCMETCPLWNVHCWQEETYQTLLKIYVTSYQTDKTQAELLQQVSPLIQQSCLPPLGLNSVD